MDALNKKISILGCGWLGLPLGKYLAENNYDVSGSTRTLTKFPDLVKCKIEPFLLDLNPQVAGDKIEPFFTSGILVICFPPRLKKTSKEFFLSQIKNLVEKIQYSKISKIVFISSTSIYLANNKEVFEGQADKGHVLYAAEKLLINGLKPLNKEILILRFSGLMGYSRHPCKYIGLTNKTSLDTPVNYIHRDDAVMIIFKLLKSKLWNEVFNVTAPIHPDRKEIMDGCAETKTQKIPVKSSTNKGAPSFKIINGDKLSNALKYKFKYPNPLFFPYTVQ